MSAATLALCFFSLLAVGPAVNAAPASHQARDDAGALVVELRLEGPLEGAELDEGGRLTRVELSLPAGERRTLRVPLSLWTPIERASDVAGRLSLRMIPETAAGQATAIAFSDLRPDLWSAELPPTLTIRSRAPLTPPAPRPGALRLALLAAAWIMVVAARRRALLALALALLFSLAILFLPTSQLPVGATVVLEGDARSSEWVSVRGALDRIEVPPGTVPWDDVLGGGEAPRWVVRGASGAPERWLLESVGSRIYLVEPLARPPVISAARLDGPALARVWVREAGGGWSRHGAWSPGDALGAAEERGDPPPGWLATGLPQGTGILLAQLAPGADAEWADADWGLDGAAAWLRLVGFRTGRESRDAH